MSKIFKIIIAIIGLLILLIVTIYFRREPIEHDLNNQAKAALNRSEFSRVTVSFEGRDGMLSGEVSSQMLSNEAGELAKQYWGVRIINNKLKVSSEKLSAFASLQGYHQNGKFVLNGVIPDTIIRTQLFKKAEAVFGAGKVTDNLSINTAVQLPDFFNDAFSAFLGLKGIDESGFSFVDSKFILKGIVPTENIKNRLGTEITNALPSTRIQNELTVMSPGKVQPSLQDLRKLLSSNTIEFDFASSELTNQSKQILDRILEMLKQIPEVEIEILGHTDSIGTEGINMQLSIARANSVRSYLISNGILVNRLFTNGLGKTQPIADNITEGGRQRNRRVELKVK